VDTQKILPNFCQLIEFTKGSLYKTEPRYLYRVLLNKKMTRPKLSNSHADIPIMRVDPPLANGLCFCVEQCYANYSPHRTLLPVIPFSDLYAPYNMSYMANISLKLYLMSTSTL
jgi:hypothetical protein